MAELMDRRPVFTIVMGCNGCGKTAWKRENREKLPVQYFDQDSIAGGVGDWNEEDARRRTRLYVEAEIDRCFAGGEDFGTESTFSGRPGPALLARAIENGYRVEGYYLGTASWEINAHRIERRVLTNTGHYIDPQRLPNRYQWSLSNVRKAMQDFDVLELLDNSEEYEPGIPDPTCQVVAEKGRITFSLPDGEMATWCRDLLWKREREVAMQRRRVRSEGIETETGS